jgi:hypothetical protein
LLRSADYQDDLISNIKMQASDTHKAKFCATPDNSVNIERPKEQFQSNFGDFGSEPLPYPNLGREADAAQQIGESWI